MAVRPPKKKSVPAKRKDPGKHVKRKEKQSKAQRLPPKPRRVGRPSEGFYRAGMLLHWLSAQRPSEFASVRRGPGYLSFAEQLVVLSWAARNIDEKKYDDQKKLTPDERFFQEVTTRLKASPVSDHVQHFGPAFLAGLIRGNVRGKRMDEAHADEIRDEIIESAIRLVDEAISVNGFDPGNAAACVREQGTTARSSLTKILQAAGIDPPSHVDEHLYKAAIVPFLSQAANVGNNHPLVVHATSIKRTLTERTNHETKASNPRVVILSGSLFSGRVTIVRHLIKTLYHEYNHLLLNDGTVLPLLAINANLSIGALINILLQFYRSNLGIKSRRAPAADQNYSRRNALAEIKEHARRFPVFLIMNDVVFVGGDPAMRALRSDHIGEIIDAVIAGHPETRALFTTESEDSAKALGNLASVRDAEFEPIHLKADKKVIWHGESPAKLSLAIVELESWNFPIAGLTWIMSGIFGERLGSARPGLSKQRIRMLHDEWRYATMVDDPALLLRLLWNSPLLAPAHRILMGVIASCPEGFTESELLQLLRAARDEGHAVPEFLCDMESLNGTIKDMGRLVEKTGPQRPSEKDAPLLVTPQGETSFSLYPWRRQAVLRQWMRSARHEALSTHWYLARVAGMRASKLARSSYWYQRDEAAARYIQAINALLASISANELGTRAKVAGRGDLTNVAALFPPLDEKHKRPSGAALMRQAAGVLFGQRENPLRQALFASDSSVILSTLARFFEPGIPWLTAETWTLSPDLSTYPQLTQILSPDQAVDLLTRTAQASLHARRFDVVLAASRLTQQILQSSPALCASRAQHVLMAEIDASMVAGADLNAVLQSAEFARSPRPAGDGFDFELKGRLTDVAARVEHLAQKYFQDTAEPKAQAQTVLMTRAGEAYNLGGQLRDAEEKFVTALGNEKAAANGGARSFLSRRAYRRAARAMVHLARKSAWINQGRPLVQPTILSNGERDARSTLLLPLPSFVADSEPYLVKAHALVEAAKSTAGAKTTADDIGQRVIEARAAVLQYDFKTAVRLIEEARSLSSFDVIGVEVLLELTAVGAQIDLDTAVVLLTQPIPGRPWPSAADIAMDATTDKRDPSSAANFLVGRAERSLKSLATYSKRDAVCELRPYAVFCRYMEGCTTVLQSLFAPGVTAQLKLLREAELELIGAIVQMELSGYKLFIVEARTWRQCVGDALKLLDGLEIERARSNMQDAPGDRP
ncbi:MAG: hypothetical protein SGI91_15230 [Alphaproteobacteria bacterium]|nr:hypothetical protein [Alphaproteobacteria bacterium]